MAQVYELADNRFLAVDMLEIVTFTDTTSDFESVLGELYRLENQNVAYEIIWLTEKVDNQSYISKIHIYIVVHKIDNVSAEAASCVKMLINNIRNIVSDFGYSYQDSEHCRQTFDDLWRQNVKSRVYAVEKKEKVVINPSGVCPFYYTEIIPSNNTEGLASLINALIQRENCGISFSIIPTKLYENEVAILVQHCSELEGLSKGISVNGQLVKDSCAQEPFEVLSYYKDNRDAPMFLSNILTFGTKEDCAVLSNKIISLLQGGDSNIGGFEASYVDISKSIGSIINEFPNYIWNVSALLMYKYRNMKIRKYIPLSNYLYRLPLMMTIEELISFFRLPVYDGNMSGVEETRYKKQREQLKEEVVSDSNIKFGQLISSDMKKVTIGCDERILSKHVLIVGMPGTGKTTFSINLMLQFAERNIPFLIVEPTKTEYRALIEQLPDIQIFTPGNVSVSPFIINPFIPLKGITVEQYKPVLVSAFMAAFSMPSPLDLLFQNAIQQCYTKYGWKDYSTSDDSDVTIFGLHEFILVFKKLLQTSNYSKDVKSNLETAGVMRLMNLIDMNSNIYDSINTIPIEDLISRPTIIELNSIENMEQKALIMALLLVDVCAYTKINSLSIGTRLKNVLMIDEAHVLLSPEGRGDNSDISAGSSTVSSLQRMLKEIRAYGTGVIIADQSPSKVTHDIIAATDTKIMFRLVEASERRLIANSTNMDAEMEETLSCLQVGEAYVYSTAFNKPQLVMTEDIREKKQIKLSIDNDLIRKLMHYWDNKQKLLCPYKECYLCGLYGDGCNYRIKADAEYISSEAYAVCVDALYKNTDKKRTVRGVFLSIPSLFAKKIAAMGYGNDREFIICVRIKLFRKLQLNDRLYKMDDKEKIKLITLFMKGSEKNG